MQQTADGIKTIIGLWGAEGDLEPTRERLTAAGADFVTPSLTEGLNEIEQFAASIS